MGCIRPNLRLRPGRVTSIDSVASALACWRDVKSALAWVIASEAQSRSSLAACPAWRRSSGGSCPRDFKRSVISPLRPRMLTRRFSRVGRSVAFAKAVSILLRRVVMFWVMRFAPFLLAPIIRETFL